MAKRYPCNQDHFIALLDAVAVDKAAVDGHHDTRDGKIGGCGVRVHLPRLRRIGRRIIGALQDDLALMTELTLTPELDESGKTISRKREKVDVLEEETEFAVGGSSGGTSVLRTIRPIPRRVG